MREREFLHAEVVSLSHDRARLQNYALRRVAAMAAHALRQIEDGNASPGLAARVASEVELVLALVSRDDLTEGTIAEVRP